MRTVLGISNVSFGLPPGAREVVNSVFLYYCTKAGLDLAIVNAESIERFASIPEHERKLAEDLAVQSASRGNVRDDHPQAALLRGAPADWREQSARTESRHQSISHRGHLRAFSRRRRRARKRSAADLPLDQRLANYIIEGSKDGLIDDLDRKLAEGAAPLDIINGPLMAGMAEVGRLFNNNELIVAEVLQSAEAMKAAVSHLEQFMEKADIEKRAKVMLATVKGDVHDIGKNLVEIILKNNGYDVINLGIKVPPEDLIRAHREHKPDAIGLSGLLVKSAQQMVITAARSARGGHPRAAAGRRRGAFRKIHAPENRAAVQDGRLLRERRDDRPAPDERTERSRRCARPCCSRTPSRDVAVVEEAAPQPVGAAGEERSPENPHGHADSRGRLSRPQSPRRAGSE